MCLLKKVWARSHVLLCWFFGLFTCITPDLVGEKCCFRVQVLPCFWVVFCCYPFGLLPLSEWTTNCLSAEPWFYFVKQNLSWVSGKYIFYEVVYRFRLISVLFFKLSATNMETGWSYRKRNAIFGLTTLKHLYEYQFLSIITEKSFWDLKNIALTLFRSCYLKALSWSSWGVYFIGWADERKNEWKIKGITQPIVSIITHSFFTQPSSLGPTVVTDCVCVCVTTTRVWSQLDTPVVTNGDSILYLNNDSDNLKINTTRVAPIEALNMITLYNPVQIFLT